MIIPDERIDEFIKRWENAFDETLSCEEARSRALQLIEFYKEIGKRPRAGGPEPPTTADE